MRTDQHSDDTGALMSVMLDLMDIEEDEGAPWERSSEGYLEVDRPRARRNHHG